MAVLYTSIVAATICRVHVHVHTMYDAAVELKSCVHVPVIPSPSFQLGNSCRGASP